MPSAFAPCRACGKPVYVGAKRCPNCRAPTSWRVRVKAMSFPLLVFALIALVIVDIALFGWPDQSGPGTTAGSGPTSGPGANSLPQAHALPTPPAANMHPPLPLPELAHTAPGAADAGAAQPGPAQNRREPERVASISAHGNRIEAGISADRLFQLVSPRDLIGQAMEPDPGNPPNLRFVKRYRIDNREFAIELRKLGSAAPYTVTSILVEPLDERTSASR